MSHHRTARQRKRDGLKAPQGSVFLHGRQIADGICNATRKFAHASRRAARKHLRRLLKSPVVRPGWEGQVYLCPHCERWHVGGSKRKRQAVA